MNAYSPTVSTDPVRLEVLRQLHTAIAEEMGATLRRAAFSPNIKERRDYSCAVFHPSGAPVAMGDHMPVHLGAMPMSVQAALAAHGPLAPGDVVILNDPFQGGTHLPDLTLVAPVHHGGGPHDDVSGDTATPRRSGEGAEPVLLGYTAARAHHSDIGGMSPGSMPLSTEIYQEGLRIPPVHLRREGQPVSEVEAMIFANVRTPDERAGDLDAQLGALQTGARRLREMADRDGPAQVLAGMEELLAYADRLLARGLDLVPDGTYRGIDYLEDDGAGNRDLRIEVTLTVAGPTLKVDFAGTAPQTTGGVNAVGAITSSAVRYVLRCIVEALLGVELPAGGGRLAGVELIMPPRSLVNAEPPSGVAAGNVETSQRITDAVLLAFQEALPDLIPALSQGTMNNVAAGGIDPRGGAGHPFTYYETAGGGMGAGPSGDGLSGVHVHMSNTLNTPVEALEHAYPFRVRGYRMREGSGGDGMHHGGEGLIRRLEFLAPTRVTILSERRERGPAGAAGGDPGQAGRNRLIRDGREEELPAKVTFEARIGDILSVETPGGGGWGSPSARPNDPPVPPDPPVPHAPKD